MEKLTRLRERPVWTLFALGWMLIFAGLIVANTVQTANGVSVTHVTYDREDGKKIRASLYTPPSATNSTPAPAILAVHGYINSREVQSGFAIEFARRGYVVLAPDQSGHGYSDAPAFADGFGGPSSLKYLRGLDFVDAENIGLEGHSMGGWSVLAAAAVYPDGYKSMVLQGSSTGAPFALEGTPDWPRNLSLVFSKYDEFSGFMWGSPNAAEVGSSEKLKRLFGSQSDVRTGQLFGNIEAGTARILHQPGVTHPGDHISPAAIGHAIDWFAKTLDGGADIPSNNQIWMFKEFGTAIALIGFVILLLGTFELLLAAPHFERLRAKPSGHAFGSRNRKWWYGAVASAVFPVLTFYPLFVLSAVLIPASIVLPQAITTQIGVWAVLTAFMLTAIGLLTRGARVTPHEEVIPSILSALCILAVGYFAVWIASFLFLLDFRFWFVGIKLLSVAQAQLAIAYLPFFGIYFYLTLRALHLRSDVSTDPAWKNYAANIAILSGGFFAFLLIQYATLFATGTLFFSLLPLETIIMHQFVPIMIFVAVFGTYSYRRTGRILPGVFTNTLLLTWYVVASQATQYPNAL